MVNIHIYRSYTVTPSEKTPTTTLSLSLCDQLKLPNHGYQLYLFTNKNHSSSSLISSTNILITSLSKTLTHYYPFAGRLSWIKPQNHLLQLHCNNKGVQFLEATCDITLKDFGSFDSTHVVQKLVPKINYDVPVEDLPLLVVQFTKFPCGSLTLGLSMGRSVLDGSSAGSFISSWAKLAKGESLDSSLIPFLDKTLLDSKILHLPPRFHHHEFSPPPLWENSSNNSTHLSKNPLFATTMLKFTKKQVEKLKNKANNNENKVRGYTSFEVISGYLWRCVSKVRFEGNWNQPTRLTTLVNCRNRLNPPLPMNYFGNATFPTVTQTCSFDDVVNKPFCSVVGKVREAVKKVNDEYVRSVLDYVANQKDMNLLRDKFYNFAKRNGQFGGEPNLYVVGWTNFPFNESDFGWGKPDCMVPGIVNSDGIGKAYILDEANGDGFVVSVCLQPFHIDALKKLFYEDMEMITSSKL
ncbi:putative transferase [Medicago truncatula]|uniref:Transferase n=1 Tax=Medicago truncatula TaxID=3880 RepID=Q2HVM4_MEDTR|nr:spermidine hydroxycinnamoyl transferase [Medicago truncatula]ABD28423.1 Transferase [Medicago truncatula]AES80868.1 transferase family protein [Medicago truncatula]RHN47487.1 putative transferase [Medicago truncatula]